MKIPDRLNLVGEVESLSTELNQERHFNELLRSQNGAFRVGVIHAIQEFEAGNPASAIACLKQTLGFPDEGKRKKDGTDPLG